MSTNAMYIHVLLKIITFDHPIFTVLNVNILQQNWHAVTWYLLRDVQMVRDITCKLCWLTRYHVINLVAINFVSSPQFYVSVYRLHVHSYKGLT